MTSTPGDLTMRVLFLKGARPDSDRGVLQQLLAVAPHLELMTLATPAEALVEVRRMLGWQALLISPSVAPEDTLGLIGSLRRDRVPIAAVPVVDEANHHLLADAVTAGADAVLLLREQTLIRVAETLTRLSHSPRLQPARFHRRLRVLYIGADPTVWNLLDELSFIDPVRLDPDRDPVMTRLASTAEEPLHFDVAVIDDEHGDPFPSEVLTAVKTQAPEASAIVLSSPAAFAAAPRSIAPGADVTFSKTGPFQQPLADTLHRLHDSLEVTRREAETRAREERLREIVDLVPAAILVIAPDGPVLAMNTEGLRLFGATSARQVVGRDLRSFVLEADRDAVTAFLQGVGPTEPSAVRVHLETVDGRTLVMAIRAVLLGRDAAHPRGLVASASVLREAPRPSIWEPPVDRTQTDQIARLQERCDELGALLSREELARVADRAAHEAQVRTLTADHESETASLRSAADSANTALDAERAATAELRAKAEAAAAALASDRAAWEAERAELQRAITDLRTRVAAVSALEDALELLRVELRETDATHGAEREDWATRIAGLEARLTDRDANAAADREAWAEARSRLEAQVADRADLEAALERATSELDGVRQNQARQEETLTAERLARDVVRDEADTLRTLLEQEQRKRADAERRQALLQDAYTHASGDRDRLIASNLFAYAVMTQQGEVVRCNDAFARLFGYVDGPEVLTVTAGRPFPMLAGRHTLDTRLTEEGRLARVESSLDRLDGQPVEVVESAVLLSDTLDGVALVERIFVRNAGGPTVDRLRAHRLEQVGSLAISMTPAIESLVTALQHRTRGSASGVPDAQTEAVAGLTEQVHALVRQLGAFGRRQTAAIEILNLDETIRQAQPMLTRVIGEFVDLDLRLASDALVLASRPDLEQLIMALATVARDSLTVGGRVIIETGDHPPASVPGAVQAAAGDAAMWMAISGYGVQPPVDMPALLQAARRCQASVQTHAAPGGGVRIDVIFARTEG